MEPGRVYINNESNIVGGLSCVLKSNWAISIIYFGYTLGSRYENII